MRWIEPDYMTGSSGWMTNMCCVVFSWELIDVDFFFFFSSRRRHTRCSRDWSSDVCSSDLEHPGFIADELRLLTKVLEAGMPALGVCLGAQLIAKAAGAEVTAGAEKEIGWYQLTLTEEGGKDRLLAGLPDTVPGFQWHGEAFEIPRGAGR